jgi:hypothetical protein
MADAVEMEFLQAQMEELRERMETLELEKFLEATVRTSLS